MRDLLANSIQEIWAGSAPPKFLPGQGASRAFPFAMYKTSQLRGALGLAATQKKKKRLLIPESVPGQVGQSLE